jgi:hypothetical protein
MRADIATIKTDLSANRNQLDQPRDEVNIVSGLARPTTGERIASVSLQAQLNKLAAWIEVLERQGQSAPSATIEVPGTDDRGTRYR